MGIAHINELRVFRGLFHIDIAIQGGIALEVDGRNTVNCGHHPISCQLWLLDDSQNVYLLPACPSRMCRALFTRTC
jgi:hypothetical protein